MRRFIAPLSALILIAVLGAPGCDKVTPVAPVGATITLSINPTRIDAQGESATVTAIIRREDGTPVNPGTQVNFSTTLGVLEPEVSTTDETGVARSTLSGDGRIGMATVAATTGAAALVETMVQIGSVAASITLTATPSDLPRDPQGDEGALSLTALVRDDTGAPLEGTVVNFASDIGTLQSTGGPVVTDDLGKAIDLLTVTRGNISVLTEPFFEVRAETAIEGGSLIEDLVQIDIRGVPAVLTLQATPSTVGDDGGSVDLLALVVDGAGFGLADTRVTFLSELGTLGAVSNTTDSEGEARTVLSLTAADITSLGGLLDFEVRAQASGLGGSVVEDSFRIRKSSCRPSANFSCTQNGVGSKEYTFTWLGTQKPDLIFVWRFVLPNGTVEATIPASPSSPPAPATVTYTFLTKAQYTVSLEVTDDADGCKATGSFSRTLTTETNCQP